MWPYDPNNQINQQLQSLMACQLASPQASVHVTKVNGRNGAETFNLPANSDVLLLDTNDPIVWLVQTDGAGYKTLTPYDISPHKTVNPEDRYKSLEDRISKLEEAVSNVKSNNGNAKWSNNQQRNDAGNRSDVKG